MITPSVVSAAASDPAVTRPRSAAGAPWQICATFPASVDTITAASPPHGGVSGDLESGISRLGAEAEPEKLGQAGSGPFEAIGRKLAVECRDGEGRLSAHELLKYASGLARLGPAAFTVVP